MKYLIRRAVGESHWTYLSWHRGRFGLLPSLGAYARLLRDGGLAQISTPCGPVWLRSGTTDQDVFEEAFLREGPALAIAAPKFILDGGANIGLTSVWFAAHFPDAVIAAVEPEASNFDMLSAERRPLLECASNPGGALESPGAPGTPESRRFKLELPLRGIEGSRDTIRDGRGYHGQTRRGPDRHLEAGRRRCREGDL